MSDLNITVAALKNQFAALEALATCLPNEIACKRQTMIVQDIRKLVKSMLDKGVSIKESIVQNKDGFVWHIFERDSTSA